MSNGLREAAAVQTVLLWEHFSDFVNLCYYFTPGPVNRGTIECIIRPVRPALVNGTTILAGDSEILVPAAELTAVPVPAVGDYVLELTGDHRWDVIAGHLTPSLAVMKLIARQVY